MERTPVCCVNGRFQFENASTVGSAKIFLLDNAPSWSSVHERGDARARFAANVFLRRMSVRGFAAML